MYATLAWRNLWRNPRRTLVTIAAIVFAAVAAVFMQSINRGSHELMLDRTVRFHTGYIQIQDARFEDEPSLDNAMAVDDAFIERLREAEPRITAVVPRIETFMLAANDASTRGAIILGIDPDAEARFNGLPERLQEGRFFSIEETGVTVITKGLAERLGLGAGETLALIGQGRFGMSASGLFEIVGILDHPLHEMNRQTVYLPLPAAQALLSAEEHVTALLLDPGRPRVVAAVADTLRAAFAEETLAVLTWRDMLPELLQLFEFDLAMPRFLTLVLYVVIGFGFFGAILTMTLERLREFGLLLALGMQRRRLALVVGMETLLMALTGVLLGLAAAWGLLFYFHLRPITLTGSAAEAVVDMGWDPVLPMSFAVDQFITQGIYVFAVALAVFLFPLCKIFRLDILKSTRR